MNCRYLPRKTQTGRIAAGLTKQSASLLLSFYSRCPFFRQRQRVVGKECGDMPSLAYYTHKRRSFRRSNLSSITAQGVGYALHCQKKVAQY